MKGISINGQKLHELEMLLELYSKGTVCHLRYPKSRIHHEFDTEELNLRLPHFLVLEMYRVGILPQDEEQSVRVEVSGKHIGEYKVIDFKYPSDMPYASEAIRMKFLRVRPRNA